jgi:hypothetical protein
MSSAQKPSSKLYLGLAVIIVGFVCLRTPPVDSFWSMTVAPLFLILGYLVLIPCGLWPRRPEVVTSENEPESANSRLIVRFTGLGVFLVSLITYCLTLWPGPRWWDSAGYMASSITMGVDGAPGSLLLQLLGRLSWFATFFVTPSARLNLLLALATALAVTIVFFTIVRLLRFARGDDDSDDTAIVTGALVASLTLAFAVSVWAHAGYTNPYGLSLFTAAVLFYLAVRWWEDPDAVGAGNFLLVAVFIFGLDLSVHRSNLLFVPGFFVMVLVRRPRTLLSGRLWLCGVGLFALGLSLQLFNMFRAQLDPQINFSNPETFGRLWDYLALKQRGISVFGADILQRNGPLWDTQINHEYLRYLGWNFAGFDYESLGVKWNALYGLPLAVGIVGFLYSFVRRRAALLILIMFLCSSALAIFYLNVPVDYFRKMDRHFLASFMLFAVWIGVGSCFLMQLLSRVTGYRPAVDWLLALLLVIALPVNALFANWKINDQSQNYTPYDYGRNLLETCEPNAILITAGDSDTFPIWYLQMVEGFRTDVIAMNYPLLNTSWRLKSLLKYQPDLPWSLTEESIDELRPMAVDSHTVTIYTSGPDSLPVNLNVVPTIDGKYQLVADQVILDILKTNRWQRPVYISIGLGGRIPLGLSNYLRFDGLALRVAPDSAERRNLSALERNVLERYAYRGLGGETMLDRESRNMTNNYRRAFAILERFCNEQGNDTARERLQEIYRNLWPVKSTTEQSSDSDQDAGDSD